MLHTEATVPIFTDLIYGTLYPAMMDRGRGRDNALAIADGMEFSIAMETATHRRIDAQPFTYRNTHVREVDQSMRARLYAPVS